ncbi:MAG: ATP-binding cassette domain-containing protein [Blautia sp.]
MFKKVLEYAGEYRKITYRAIAAMLVGLVMNLLPFFFIYQIIRPLLTGESLPGAGVFGWVAAIAVCGVLYALFYVWGLSLSHEAAYHTLENLRLSLQGKLERQPLGVIQEKGVGSIKKMFIEDIDSIEILLAHTLPEGFANLLIPILVFVAMFFADWKLALLSLASLPLGLVAMMAMYKYGTGRMGDYYAAAQRMNNTIVEYINGMEVVKVFNRDGESYKRFEKDVRGYRDFTLAWYKVCWPWMALYNSILPCVAMLTLPVGSYLVLRGYSSLPDLALVLCMSFGIGAPLLRAIGFMSTLPQINFKIDSLEQMMGAPFLQQTEDSFTGKDHKIQFERVHFAYGDEEVLHGISLDIPEGGLTALVGESGSGKSTLAKLLVHYYDVTGGPLGLVAMMAMYKYGTGRMGDYYAAAQRMNNTIVEYINGMEVVKVFNRDGESYKRFEKDVRGYRDFTLAWYKVCWPWMALYNSILPCVAMLTLPVGSYLVLRGYSSLPDLALVLCMSFGIGAPLLRAIGFMSTLPQINFKIDSLEQMMGAPFLQQTEDSFTGKDHKIQFERVHFAYGDEEVLHGISLDIPEGGLTALVGESGSGKSTLAKLLVHYYDVTGGAIRIGGQDIRQMSVEALNNEISYVSQEQFLFNMSLLENIRLGRLDATDQEVMEAAEKAQCGEFLTRLDKGIHTMAGDGGKQLSGGERQRISLARAILKDAPVVVLDEATAFMDPENEEKMNAAIAEVIKGKTVIVIAHRLHSIVNADQICVLHGGKLESAGTHQELLEESGEYRKLWKAAEDSTRWKVTAWDEKGDGIV